MPLRTSSRRFMLLFLARSTPISGFYCLAVAVMLHAQARSSVGAIDGVVTDTGLVPLADASISVLRSRIGVMTDRSGRFRIGDIPPGSYVLSIRRLGYAPRNAAVTVSRSDTIRIAIELQPIVNALPAVVISSRPAVGALAEFEQRRSQGRGQFLTGDQIAARNSVRVRELLRSFMGVEIRGNAQAVNRREGFARRPCPFQFFVDDVALPTPDVERDLPSPTELAGIEVYTNSAQVPLRYATAAGGGACGVILLWTKRGH